MLRLRLTGEDLLRTRFASGPVPLMELGLAVATIGRGDAVFARWSRQTRLPRAARPLFQLIPPTGAGPMFVDQMSEGLDDGLDKVLSTPQEYARAELRRACRPTPWTKGLAARDRDAWRVLEDALRGAYDGIIDREQARIHASFHADLTWRRMLLSQEGLRAALASIHPRSRWNGTTLEIDVPGDSEHAPEGRGLIVIPSTFWTGRPMVADPPDGPQTLVYPALTPLPLVEPETGDALAALLGRTRAEILQVLTEPHTTTELARKLGISGATASVHAKTLRGAGLIATRRAGKAVTHTATTLGLRLRDGS